MILSAFLPRRPDLPVPPGEKSCSDALYDLRAQGVRKIYVPTFSPGGWANPAIIEATHEIFNECDKYKMIAVAEACKPTKNPMTSNPLEMGAITVRDGELALLTVYKAGPTRWRRNSEHKSKYVERDLKAGESVVVPVWGGIKNWHLEHSGEITDYSLSPWFLPPEQIRERRGKLIDWLGDGTSYLAQCTQPRWELYATYRRFKTQLNRFWHEFSVHDSLRKGGYFCQFDEAHTFGWDKAPNDIQLANVKALWAYVATALSLYCVNITGKPMTIWGDLFGGHNDLWEGDGCYANNMEGVGMASTLDYLSSEARKRIDILAWGYPQWITADFLQRGLATGWHSFIPCRNWNPEVSDAWDNAESEIGWYKRLKIREKCWYTEG